MNKTEEEKKKLIQNNKKKIQFNTIFHAIEEVKWRENYIILCEWHAFENGFSHILRQISYAKTVSQIIFNEYLFNFRLFWIQITPIIPVCLRMKKEEKKSFRSTRNSKAFQEKSISV